MNKTLHKLWRLTGNSNKYFRCYLMYPTQSKIHGHIHTLIILGKEVKLI